MITPKQILKDWTLHSVGANLNGIFSFVRMVNTYQQAIAPSLTIPFDCMWHLEIQKKKQQNTYANKLGANDQRRIAIIFKG